MIEGTQASLAEIFELYATGGGPNANVEEVLAHVDAMDWAVTAAPLLPPAARTGAPASCGRRRTGSARAA